MRTRTGRIFDTDTKSFVYDDKHEYPTLFTFIPIGEMADGSKVWCKCDKNKEVIDDTQYLLTTRGGMQTFIEL